jgi:hypothetical protein
MSRVNFFNKNKNKNIKKNFFIINDKSFPSLSHNNGENDINEWIKPKTQIESKELDCDNLPEGWVILKKGEPIIPLGNKHKHKPPLVQSRISFMEEIIQRYEKYIEYDELMTNERSIYRDFIYDIINENTQCDDDSDYDSQDE